jgi:N-methylhydantoinase B
MKAPATDPVTLEVVRNRMDRIADEMELTLLASSHSAIVKEALDASAAIFDARGREVAQAAALPLHLGMVIPAVERFVELFPPDTMREGDAYILNDPFDGGTHLPDIVITVPVFSGGELAALATTISHHQEIGGRSPGSTPMDATEIFQEGLRIPPLRLREAGTMNATFLAMLERNVRIPQTVLGDLRGQLAACEVGRRRMVELIDRYGVAEFNRQVDALLDLGEALTRKDIERIPDGTYEFVDYLDHDGIDVERRIRIQATVTVAGSDIEIDMTGTDPQVAGPLNCVPASTLGAIYYFVRILSDPAAPNNAGCYRPVTAKLPYGSIVNAAPPAAVNGRAVVVRRTVDALIGALAPVMRTLPAASSGHPLNILMGGTDPLTGKAYVAAETSTGGMGSRPTKDGVDAIQTDTSNSQNIPVEALELEFPIRVGHYRLRPDSGGPGRFRGGLGLEKRLEMLRGEMNVSHRGERHLTAPWGLFGGHAGTTAKSVLRRADGSEVVIPSKLDFRLALGEQLDLYTSGGGGYGDPLERDPARVLDDVLDAKVSRAAAERSYGVVIAERAVDREATTALRARMAAERGPVDWIYDRGPLGKDGRAIDRRAEEDGV